MSLSWGAASIPEALAWAALAALALFGHAVLWVALASRIRATGLPRHFGKPLVLACELAVLLIPLGLAATPLARHGPSETEHGPLGLGHPASAYGLLCCGIALFHVPHWLLQRCRDRNPAVLAAHSKETIKMTDCLGFTLACGLRTRLFAKVPGNQLLQAHVERKELFIPRLPAKLDGLKILHLSDLHLSGRISRDYFHEATRIVNSLEPDIIAITGDICDKVECLDWVVPIFGPMECRHGKFAVLGNHDLRLKRRVPRLLDLLAHAGVKTLEGCWERTTIRDQPMLIAGDAIPWFKPTVDLTQAPRPTSSGGPMRMLLAHSPDRFGWARKHDFDLVLAGHTHGGQICLPGIGPIVCPSWHGVRYAVGVFHESPTVLHVSRGVSCLFPLRLWCPPEISLLVLRVGQPSLHRDDRIS